MSSIHAESPKLEAARHFRRVRRNRILLGASACLASAGLAVACISTAPAQLDLHDAQNASAHLATGANVSDEGSSPARAARGGPVVIAHCSDGSEATFELDRAGSTQIITGRFKSPESGDTSLRLSAEFRRAGSDDDSTIALEDLAGSVIAPRTEKSRAGSPRAATRTHGRAAALETTHAFTLKSLSFEGIQEPVGGHISLQWGHSQMQLSGCHFNVAVLERMRGQEHLPFVIARAK